MFEKYLFDTLAFFFYGVYLCLEILDKGAYKSNFSILKVPRISRIQFTVFKLMSLN